MEWWQVLAFATCGGILGGFVVYRLSDKGRPKIVVWKDNPPRDEEESR